MNARKLGELREVLDATRKYYDVQAAKSRIVAFLRSEANKEEVEDFKEIDPPPAPMGITDADALVWKTHLLSYVDGLLDAWRL